MKRRLMYLWDIITVGNREREQRFLEAISQEINEQDMFGFRAIDAALVRSIERMEANLAEFSRLEEENMDEQ